MEHVHSCTECYRKLPCNMDCSLEAPSLKSEPMRGGFIICEDCQRTLPSTEVYRFNQKLLGWAEENRLTTPHAFLELLTELRQHNNYYVAQIEQLKARVAALEKSCEPRLRYNGAGEKL